MKKVIMISGKKRSGKDTVANIISQFLEESEILHIAAPMKRIVSKSFGLTLDELEELKNNPDKHYMIVTDSEFLLHTENEKISIERDEVVERLKGGFSKETGIRFDTGTAKKIVSVSTEPDEEHKTNFRRVLQRFGTEAVKPIFGDDIWVKTLIKKIRSSFNEYILIPDFRFKAEYEGVFHGGMKHGWETYTVRVASPGTEENPDAHPSETELDDFSFDYTIENVKEFGLSYLESEVETFLKEEFKKSFSRMKL